MNAYTTPTQGTASIYTTTGEIAENLAFSNIGGWRVEDGRWRIENGGWRVGGGGQCYTVGTSGVARTLNFASTCGIIVAPSDSSTVAAPVLAMVCRGG